MEFCRVKSLGELDALVGEHVMQEAPEVYWEDIHGYFQFHSEVEARQAIAAAEAQASKTMTQAGHGGKQLHGIGRATAARNASAWSFPSSRISRSSWSSAPIRMSRYTRGNT